MREHPESYQGHSETPHATSAYCYIIGHADGTRVCVTGYDARIRLANLPAHLGVEDPQTFTPSGVRHGRIPSSDRFEKRTTSLMVASDDARLRKFFMFSAATRLTCAIIRVAGERLNDDAVIDYETDAIIADVGVLSDFSFEGAVIGATLVPEPHYVDNAIPRFFFCRQCNWRLYGPGCGLDKDDWKTETTILSINRAEREIVVAGRVTDQPDGYYDGGYFDHADSGQSVTIAWSRNEGASDTKLKLWNWHPDLGADDAVTLYAGCRHTTDDCTNKFANQANFGGFPFIPNRNPAVNGAG